jgi:excinuclease UvrABC ATPase subunit
LILQPRSRNPARYSFVILNEPTTGPHFHDVKKLSEVLHELVSQGNTVVVIEHNLELVSFVIPGRRASVEPGIHSHER